MLVIQVLMHGYLLAPRELPSSCRGPRFKNRGRSVSRTSTLRNPVADTGSNPARDPSTTVSLNYDGAAHDHMRGKVSHAPALP